MDISVITCAHRPRPDLIARVWDALQKQTLARSRWEYLLVDNANDTETAQWLADKTKRLGRCVREDGLGLTRARLRGIAEAQGEILVFVDDDCLLDPDYLDLVAQIFSQHGFLGAAGGYGRAEYEVPPPAWLNNATLRQYCLDMVVPEQGPDLIYARVQGQLGAWFPIGAGMCIRRNVARTYAENTSRDEVALAFDRTGRMLSGAGDLDMGISAIEQGYALGKSRDLRFTHVVPAFRLELPYFLRLLYMSQYSMDKLLIHRGWKPVPPQRAPNFWQKTRSWMGRMAGGDKRYSPEERCWQALARGRKDGASGAPLDSRYCGK